MRTFPDDCRILIHMSGGNDDDDDVGGDGGTLSCKSFVKNRI